MGIRRRRAGFGVESLERRDLMSLFMMVDAAGAGPAEVQISESGVGQDDAAATLKFSPWIIRNRPGSSTGIA